MSNIFGKKILRNRMNAISQSKIETRDAVVWDVLPDQRKCRVKIQGSNNLIMAWYLENWEKTPQYLKPGNSVKINHTGGVRGRIEVIGHGSLIPTPILGGSAPPSGAAGEDGIISGLAVIETSPQSMAVQVSIGSYQFGGEVYFVTSPVTVPIDSIAVGTYFRYDVISIDETGTPTYTKGTTSNGVAPTMPATPSGNLLLNYIFLWNGTTVISSSSNIGKAFSARTLTTLEVTASPSDMSWGTLHSHITLRIRDQYGMYAPSVGSPGYLYKLELVYGNGTLDPPSGEKYSTSYQATMIYYRLRTAGDKSPTFICRCSYGGYEALASLSIILRNASGNPMY
jgi:hypothetical protein